MNEVQQYLVDEEFWHYQHGWIRGANFFGEQRPWVLARP